MHTKKMVLSYKKEIPLTSDAMNYNVFLHFQLW